MEYKVQRYGGWKEKRLAKYVYVQQEDYEVSYSQKRNFGEYGGHGHGHGAQEAVKVCFKVRACNAAVGAMTREGETYCL